MDLGIILTYRCNARCSMCNVWKNPSLPGEEVSLEVLEKLPDGFNYLNLTGGEPTLRADLESLVDLLYPKTARFEISSNGLQPEKLYPIIRKYPNTKIRFSLEGFEETNNRVRGEKNGFQKKIAGLLQLKEQGGTDLGFAITIQDDNADQLVKLFEFCCQHGFELATSTMHNGFQFYKSDNVLYDRLRTARYIEDLITVQLKTSSPKNWFRAYLNLGIVARALGHDRLLPCMAGTDFAFIDPWGEVYACNVRPDLKIGSLAEQSWQDLMESTRRKEVLVQVTTCKQNCWMVGSAKTAMRHPRFTRLPRWTPLAWVLENKLRVLLGGRINLNRAIDHSIVYQDPFVTHREYYTGQPIQLNIQHRDDPHYDHSGSFENR